MVTIQFMPYTEIEDLTSVGRIRKLLNIAKDNKIVLLQGRLKAEEEAELIQATMEEINKDFKGIELAVIEPKEKEGGFKGFFTNLFLGDRLGMTVIGPATVVKSIKRNPNKIELLTKEIRKRKKR
ncbi:DUF2073 domain-containing protein [Candidatus Woesearchaeota archaeon]|nr:DUF2073 domain-containing protein [Candidatus Woesearchaeota archaeon]